MSNEQLDRIYNLEQDILSLITGGTVFIKDDEDKKYIQKRLREIKNHCATVLSQLKSNN
jgi:hypothetical protein